jgi:hypothetical protein
MHKFSLIENANDSLQHALQHMGPVNANNTGDWKRIIVDLAHVVELLFKEMLRRAHPAFVFENIDKYPSEDVFTVGAEKALKRVQNICNVKFSKEELSAINTARKKRNEIEHFEFSVTEHEAKAIAGQILSFIFNFFDEYLNLRWKVMHLRDTDWNILRQYTDFYANLIQKAQEKIDSDDINIIKCTSCHNETFCIEEEKCLVCGHTEEVMRCNWCKEPYIFSSCEYGEEAKLCPSCEWKDGYASANFEKY